MEALNRKLDSVVAYEGGSFRERSLGKGIYHAIPAVALKRIAQRYEYGEVKYGQSDAFMDGLPVSSCFDSAMRHLVAYLAGDNTEDHLAACIWNCCAMMYMEVEKPEWQDIEVRKSIDASELEYISYVKGEFK